MKNKRKPQQLPYKHNDFYGIRTRLEWVLFIQDKWDTDFISAENEFDLRMAEGQFTLADAL